MNAILTRCVLLGMLVAGGICRAADIRVGVVFQYRPDAKRLLVLCSQPQRVTQRVLYGGHDAAAANHTVDFRIEYGGEIVRRFESGNNTRTTSPRL